MINFTLIPRSSVDANGRRRTFAALTAGVALMAAAAGPASADPGAPGATFPEQPGTSLLRGCDAILTNPNNAFYNRAPAAAGIVTGLTIDACVVG